MTHYLIYPTLDLLGTEPKLWMIFWPQREMATETQAGNELPGGSYENPYDPIAIDISRQKAETYLKESCTGDYIV